MRRRSFFGVVFGALAATRLSRGKSKGGVCPRPKYYEDAVVEDVVVIDPAPPYQPLPPGMAGAYHPMEGGFYKPGDTFIISGRGFGKNPRLRYKLFKVPEIN